MSKIMNQTVCLIMSSLLLAALCTVAAGKIIYVDDDDAGANDGSSWENAYIYLQDALADANSVEKPVEIRVAQGIYKPDQGANQIPGDREATFTLISGVTLIGGYAGLGEPDPNARDVQLYDTILSGDLNGDDVQIDDVEVAVFKNLKSEPSRMENSYNVVTGNETDDSAILDGFTITAGNANVFEHSNGGGLFNTYGTPRITNCTLKENSAWHGGGLNNIGNGSPILTNCIFSGNEANYGGGMHNGGINSNPVLINCTFLSNAAGDGGGVNNWYGSPSLSQCFFISNTAGYGGGIRNNHESSPVLTNCTFSDNSAYYGGGMTNESNSNPKLTNCTFIVNSAEYGGGMYNFRSYPMMNACKFRVNSALFYGGAAYNYASNLTLTNCILEGNTAQIYGGVLSNNQSNLILTNCTFNGNSAPSGSILACTSRTQKKPSVITIINSILWNGIEEIWNNDNSEIVVAYSCIQGGWPGEGNIDIDPCFVTTGYWDLNDTPDNKSDDLWVDGDYHLKSQTGRWDPVSESWVVVDVTSLCIDAGDPNMPVGDEPEPNGGIINMGAYGGTEQASKSP